MTDRPVLYYANGTNYMANYFGQQLGAVSSPGSQPTVNVKGLGGQYFPWDGFIPTDPFPLLLDPTLWAYDRVQYPASTISMNVSITIGVNYVVDKILATPPGTPFSLGGYSQGAAVMHRVVNETRQGRLSGRRADLRACVTFGAPTREANHLWPGAPGWSGADDVPGSTRGGHGVFPGIFRMVNTEDHVWDFAMPGEPITSVGDSLVGLAVSAFVGLSLNSLINLIPTLIGIIPFMNYSNSVAVPPPGVPRNPDKSFQWAYTDPVHGAVTYHNGGGHTCYPFFPPPDANGVVPSTGDTCYQIAARYLNSVGAQIKAEQDYVPPLEGVTPQMSWVQTA